MPTLDEVLTELAAAPPSAFTEARDSLVTRLTKLGQAEAAARIKAMRRPSAALWAANRVARTEPESIERLIVAADRIRAAQLGRGASAADFASVNAEQRAILAQLTQRAGALLSQAGIGATHQVLLRIEITLAGAAADPELRPALQQGRLEHELGARGFDVFAGEPLPARPSSEKSSAPVERRTARTAAPAAIPAPQLDQERDEARLTAARDAVAQAEARASQQREHLDSARRRIEELTEMLRDARRREVEATREEKRAADALRSARETLSAAERNRRAVR
jgi:hypothetical protein